MLFELVKRRLFRLLGELRGRRQAFLVSACVVVIHVPAIAASCGSFSPRRPRAVKGASNLLIKLEEFIGTGINIICPKLYCFRETSLLQHTINIGKVKIVYFFQWILKLFFLA